MSGGTKLLPEQVITVRYPVLYPSVTLCPLTRIERRAIIERINPASRTSTLIQHSPAVVGRHADLIAESVAPPELDELHFERRYHERNSRPSSRASNRFQEVFA